MRTPALLACAITLVATTASRVESQSAQRWSLQFSGLSVGAQGEAYEGLSRGNGFEAQVRLTPSVWSFGAGLQFSSHSIDFDGTPEDVTLTGIFIEPRRVIDVGSSSFAPYVSGRLSFLQQAIDLDVGGGTTVSASASGAQINGGGGVLFRLSPRVNLDVGATYGLINFSDVEVSASGLGTVTVEGSSGTGRNLVLRLGLAIGLGR